MSDSERGGGGLLGTPRSKNRFARLKKSKSEEDYEASSPVKPHRNFFRKGNDTSEAAAAQKQARVFRRRRSTGNNGNNNQVVVSHTPATEASSSHGGDPKSPRAAKRFQRKHHTGSSSLDGAAPVAVDNSKMAWFARRRAKRAARKSKRSGSDSEGDSFSDSNEHDEGGMSSDEDQSRQQQQQQQQYSRPRDETLDTGRPRNVSAPRSTQGTSIDMLPLRKMVSFDAPTTKIAHNAPLPRISRSSDQIDALQLNNSTDTGGGGANGGDSVASEDVNDLFGYNTNDFPAPSVQSGNPQYAAGGQGRRQSRERARYSVYQGNSTVKKRFRVKPHHCFPAQAQYMTEEEIYADSLTPSKQLTPLESYLAPTGKIDVDVPESVREMWGSPAEDGRIGAIRVEVLGCVSLNRTKPDVAVYLVCGDSAFCTDILAGYRSPMWPSVSRRACIIPVHHAYAKLYVGVFDVRSRKNKENDVFCGRVALDLASIRPGTEYDTTMPLRASSFVYDKRKRGVIRLRFSMHWFSERAAVISYFKSVRSIANSCPLVEGQPAIPCADPKTFRNVAVTVYGQDLPGKYSRNAFRATMREFNLYQQNLRLMVKVLVLDAMLYEKPWMSLYLFVSAMYCVVSCSVRLVPAIVVGYILILYLENYKHFVENTDFHLGYKPITISEVFMALLLNTNESGEQKATTAFRPIEVQKRTKRRRGAAAPLRRMASKDETEMGGAAEEDENDGEIKPLDHREFPFSDRDAYPNRAVEESLAAGSSKGGAGRLHGRLSVYYTPDPSMDAGSGGEDESEEGSDHDDETVMTESQMMGDSMFDLDSDEEEDGEMNEVEGTDFNYKRAMMFQSQGEASAKRRIKLGPPQDTDATGGKKVPPQVQLKRVENLMYKASMGVSVELVHPPPRTEMIKVPSVDETGMTAPSAEVQASVSKKAKKIAYDDFDKLLGLQSRSANPVHRIMSSFMGPLMRMIRVGVYLVRISFNATTWRDPYLSFWILMTLSLLCFILIIFPWRAFFFLTSFTCLGPQNVFVRRYLEKKAARKAQEKLDKENEVFDPPTRPANRRQSFTRKQSVKFTGKETGLIKDKVTEKPEAKRGFFAKRRTAKDGKSADKRSESMDVSASGEHVMETERPTERPAFQPEHHAHPSSNKKVQQRAVAIPYSCVRKERFYDWPPDPTVSRATPTVLDIQVLDDDDSLTASVPDIPIPDQDENHSPSGNLRQRRRSHTSTAYPGPADIPTNITF